MSMFKKAKSDNSIEAPKDSLGGYTVPDSDAYTYTIEVAYGTKAKSGALAVVLKLKCADHELQTTQYVTSGDAKGGNNYYVSPKGTKVYLPGYVIVNDICNIVTGEDLSELEETIKSIPIYDYEKSKEVPKKVPVLMDLVGKQISLGVIKTLEDRYNDPSKYRTYLDVKKVFDPETDQTLAEKVEEREATFKDKWLTKYKDSVEDKREESLKDAPEAEVGSDATDPFSDDDDASPFEDTSNTVEEEEEIF